MHPNHSFGSVLRGKTSGTTLKPAKPYNFAIEDVSDRSKRLVFAISRHTSLPAVDSLVSRLPAGLRRIGCDSSRRREKPTRHGSIPRSARTTLAPTLQAASCAWRGLESVSALAPERRITDHVEQVICKTPDEKPCLISLKLHAPRGSFCPI